MYYTPPHLSKTHFPPPSTSSIFFRDLIYNVKKETKGKRNTLTLLYCLAALVRWLNEWHPPGPIRSLKKKMKIGSGAMCSPRWLFVSLCCFSACAVCPLIETISSKVSLLFVLDGRVESRGGRADVIVRRQGAFERDYDGWTCLFFSSYKLNINLETLCLLALLFNTSLSSFRVDFFGSYIKKNFFGCNGLAFTALVDHLFKETLLF